MLLATFAAGCTFDIVGLPMEPADLTATPPDLAMTIDQSMLDSAPTTDLLQPGVLMLAHASLGAGPFDLTGEGTHDWIQLGLATATDVNRKTTGGSSIQVTMNGTPTQYGAYTPGFTWTDGTPTANEPGTHSGVYIIGVGNGFDLSVPADTTLRTLRLYLTQYRSVGVLHAQLSDGSAVSQFDTQSGTNIYHQYTIQYSASQPGESLQVTWTVQSFVGGTGTVDFLAATWF